jgi:DNA-binding MarR family transcriptional regulator
MNRADHATVATLLRILTGCNEIGVHATASIEAAGHGEVSSNGEILVLAHLSQHGSQRPRQLLDVMSMTSGGLSNLLARLEGLDLVIRRYGLPGDRRGAAVSLTTSGRRTIGEIARAVDRSLTEDAALQERIVADVLSLQPDVEASPAAGAPTSAVERVVRLARLGIRVAEGLRATERSEPLPTKAALVLCYVADKGSAHPRDLRAITGLTSGGVTLLLDRLERQQYIGRSRGASGDGRDVDVHLTRRGRRRLDVVTGTLREHLGEIYLAVMAVSVPIAA